VLILSNTINGKRVMSIHHGGAIAKIQSALIDPSKLKIEAFEVIGPGIRFFSILHSTDIREWGHLGAIINSEDDIMEVDESIPKILALTKDGFNLIGIQVRTEQGKRLGKVSDFVFESEGFNIVKLYVEKSVGFGIFKDPIILERSCIVNVTKKFIVVDTDSSVKASLEENVEYGFNG
jgi:sporulation protein YlmC with PRC-barrel domain